MGYRCERCGHEWVPRSTSREPRSCPKCGSASWDKPKKQTAMQFEEFRDRIKAAIESSKTPITWTEVRTTAKLPQAFPNNQWVRRMEKDFGLIRERDANGIMRWRIP